MATINYYLDPAGAVTIDAAESVGASLLSRWPNGIGVPSGLRIYRGDVAGCNDITDAALADITLLTAPSDDVYNCVVTAGEVTTILAVIAVVVSVASVLLAPSIPAAPANANRNQQSPNNSFGARSNQPRVNQRAADIRGKQPRAYPDLLQLPYRRYKDNVEFEYLYGQISEGYCSYTDIKDGDTAFFRLGGRLAIYGPGTSPISGVPEFNINGAPDERLYVVTQSNEIDGVTLQAPNASGITTATITVTPSGLISVNEGIDFTQFVTVGGTVALTDFQYFYYDPELMLWDVYYLDGTYNVSAVTALTVQTDAVWSFILGTSYVIPREDPRPTAPPRTLYPSINGVGVGGQTAAINVTGYDRILINVVAQNGLYKENNDGKIPTSVSFKLTEWELSAGIRTTNKLEVFGSVVTPSDISNSAGTSLEVTTTYPESEITLERTTDTDKIFDGTVVDEIKWRDLYLLNDVAAVDTAYATTVHAEIKATETALRVKERKLNMSVTRKVAAYNGDGTFTTAENTITDLFAPVIASIWRDPLFGRGEDDEVNWANLFSTQAAMIAYYGESDPCRVGYTFDSDKITAEDAIKLICNAVNVIPYRIGSVLNFWFESPQTQSAMFFGHRFKHPNTETRARFFGPENDYTGVELTYYSEVTEAFEIVRRGSSINPFKIELSGCLTARGAQIRADREWNKLRYGRVQTVFDATSIGRMAVPGMRIDVVDNTRRAPYDGEIRAISGLTVTISQPIELATPSAYSMVLTRSDGSLESIGIASQLSADKLVLAAAPSQPVQVSRLADRTAYSIGTDDMRTKMAMLIREITPKDYNRVTIAAINYDARYYSEDN